MHSNRTTDDDFEVGINGQLVLRDGHKYVVPMRALDGLQKSVAEHFGRTTVQDSQKIVDGFGRDGLHLNRPGHRMYASGQGDQSFYDEYDARISTAYRDADNSHTSSTEGVGSGGFAGKEDRRSLRMQRQK